MPSVCRSISVVYTNEDSDNNFMLEHFLVDSPAFDITIHNLSGVSVFIYPACQKDVELKVPRYVVDPGTTCALLKAHSNSQVYGCFSRQLFYTSY
jgi:hypothetical protein